MATLNRAFEIAKDAHKDQRDKAGKPYFKHVKRVSDKGKTETEKICGILHDLVEDTTWTFAQLQKEGFTIEVIEVLKLLTRNPNEDYEAFIERICSNPIAVAVKINNVEDNLDITRLEKITETDLERINRYLNALPGLRAVLSTFQEAAKKAADEKEKADNLAKRTHYIGCILGGAIGDALGAPIEFMSASEIHASIRSSQSNYLRL
jgi:hypothetical protein